MIRLGLIGAGSMAGVYVNRIDDIAEAQITAVASPNAADEFVNEHVPSATAYASAEAMCETAGLDAVAILTPTHTHRELVSIAADLGLDAICEKPLARTYEDGVAIADIVEKTGITFMTAHAVRFFPEYEMAKERVDAGEIGTPGVARTRRAFGYLGERGWIDDDAKSGGVLLDLAVHDFDYLRWLLGDVEWVFARHSDWGDEGRSETSLTLLRFENGAVGHVEAWWIEVPTVPFTTAFELAGDEGLIEFANDDVNPIRHFGMTDVNSPRDPIGHDLPLRKDGYYRQLAHFVACIETGSEPAIPVKEGLASMRVSLAAIESAKRGVPVAPAEVEP